MTRFLGNVIALVLLGALAYWILEVLGISLVNLPGSADIMCALSWVDGLIQALCLIGFAIGAVLCFTTAFKSPVAVGLLFGAGVLAFIRYELIAPYLWGCVP